MLDLFLQYGFYDVWGHYLFYLFVAAHSCLLGEVLVCPAVSFSTLQFSCAMMVAALVPTIVTNIYLFSSMTAELLVGVGLDLLLSIMLCVLMVSAAKDVYLLTGRLGGVRSRVARADRTQRE